MNKIGFGFLRLPRLDPKDETSIDLPKVERMVDDFLAAGGSYFDTAYTYLGGASETALRETLVKRHPRSAYQVANKLPSWKITSRAHCDQVFAEQQARTGLEYFDVYLLHWLNAANYAIAEQHDEFGFLQQLKAAGKVGKIGFSYHDNAALLDRILTRHPEVELVQLQLNYLDWDSAGVQSRACYEVCCRHGKQVIVMEPVKGGTLAKLPEAAEQLLRTLRPDDSPARWAIRFAQTPEQVQIVLSGMSTPEQIAENMAHVEPLSAQELAACAQAASLITADTAVACTACRYCVDGCPMGIAIPDYFALYNEYCRSKAEGWKVRPVYKALTLDHGAASACIACGACEAGCPQQLPIIRYLQDVAAELEK